MSTPIEIVRAQVKWWHEASDYSTPPSTAEEYFGALASVLRDAERFRALERAHGDTEVGQGWAHCVYPNLQTPPTPLAELADRLREEAK